MSLDQARHVLPLIGGENDRMKKAEYLGQQGSDVQLFINWMSLHLDDGVFQHAYMDRTTHNLWQCESLYNAYENYEWGHQAIVRLDVEAGSTFQSNLRALNALRDDLKDAITRGNNLRTCQAAVDVVKWGGVSNHNEAWLKDNETGLADLIKNVRDALDAGDALHSGLTRTMRFNAGMTKVYSLVCESLIIYDSRVAAALCWAVRMFCEETHIPLPTLLKFPWAPSKEGDNPSAPKCRDPRSAAMRFMRLRDGYFHAKWNLYASWLLNAVLDHESSRFAQIGPRREQLRALEAALFMYGYDLPQAVPAHSAAA